MLLVAIKLTMQVQFGELNGLVGLYSIGIAIDMNRQIPQAQMEHTIPPMTKGTIKLHNLHLLRTLPTPLQIIQQLFCLNGTF